MREIQQTKWQKREKTTHQKQRLVIKLSSVPLFTNIAIAALVSFAFLKLLSSTWG